MMQTPPFSRIPTALPAVPTTTEVLYVLLYYYVLKKYAVMRRSIPGGNDNVPSPE